MEAQLQGADLRETQIQRAYLQEANLQMAILEDAHMQGTILTGAQMQGAKLLRADLLWADLEGVSLQGSVLKAARFDRASLRGAQMNGAEVGTDRLNTVFARMINKIGTAFGDCSVMLPVGMAWPEHWPAWELDGSTYHEYLGQFRSDPESYVPPSPEQTAD